MSEQQQESTAVVQTQTRNNNVYLLKVSTALCASAAEHAFIFFDIVTL